MQRWLPENAEKGTTVRPSRTNDFVHGQLTAMVEERDRMQAVIAKNKQEQAGTADLASSQPSDVRGQQPQGGGGGGGGGKDCGEDENDDNGGEFQEEEEERERAAKFGKYEIREFAFLGRS